MRIIQITDLHIGNEDEFPFGVNVRANFLRILEKAEGLKPDMIVLSGDLCMHQGDRKIYEWIYKEMQQTGTPFRVISGNHDSSKVLSQVFKLEPELHGEELYFEDRIDGHRVLFLDTAVGTMSQDQLNWVKEHIANPMLVFMHHPPIKAGVPHMDSLYPLQNAEEFRALFNGNNTSVPVFCGHYHVGKSLFTQTLQVHITPSCFFQIDDRTEEFKVAHHQIALRTIDLEKDHLATAIHYYPGVSVK